MEGRDYSPPLRAHQSTSRITCPLHSLSLKYREAGACSARRCGLEQLPCEERLRDLV